MFCSGTEKKTGCIKSMINEVWISVVAMMVVFSEALHGRFLGEFHDIIFFFFGDTKE